MTENEYNYLMGLYVGSEYCEFMCFYEYLKRYGEALLESARKSGKIKNDVDLVDSQSR